jgi:hypothetical protein
MKYEIEMRSDRLRLNLGSDDAAEVPARQRLRLVMVFGYPGGGTFYVDSGQSHQGRDEVHVAGGGADPARSGSHPWAFDQEGDPDGLVEGVVPLLLHPAVGAEQVAVVGGEHDDGVVGHA